MATIVWNFGALHVGGGRQVGLDLLTGLTGTASANRNVCVVDKRLLSCFAGPSGPDVVEVDVASPARRVWTDQVMIPELIRARRAHALVTLGNIGTWKPGVPHGMFVQTPYLAYSGAALAGLRRNRRYYSEKLRALYFSRSLESASSVVVQTETMRKRFCQRWNVAEEKVAIIAGSPPLSFIEALGGRRWLGGGQDRYFITASSDDAHKNLDHVARVARTFAERGVGLRFVLTLDSGGAAARRLRRLAGPSGAALLEFTGQVGPERMAELVLGSCGAFLPSLLETLGLPYLEAMSAGAPVVASDRPFSREVCGDYATYFDPFDSNGTADALEYVLRSNSPHVPQPPARRTARDVIAEFDSWASALARG